ncbi:unnamed protein product [Blepharisma stoltei]|uniref:C3H1-type domain-containing protein n=1 Tax=Blepharisma stoltei TaxID=1481888 RepID=A0AAU9IJF8_9CILI|nr:unnamed protein product [Blepharisma stoltei]
MLMDNFTKTYKTKQCRNFSSSIGCTLGLLCNFYHTEEDRRRLPDQTYEPILCIEAVISDVCAHESCQYCRNQVEYLFHPSNYKTKECIYRRASRECIHKMCPYTHPEDKSISQQVEEIKAFEPSIIVPAVELASPEERKFYIYKEEIKKYEDRKTEFKSCSYKSFNVAYAVDLVVPYVSAFLNTEGGTLYYGIRDDGMVTGVILTRKVRDNFIVTLDSNLNRFSPHLTGDEYEIKFVDVMKKEDLKKINDMYVIEIKVEKSKNNEVYFTHKSEAYIKRDASITQLKGLSLVKFYEKRKGAASGGATSEGAAP